MTEKRQRGPAWHTSDYMRALIAERVLKPEIQSVLEVGVSSKEDLRRQLSQKWGCALSATLLNDMLFDTGFDQVFDTRFKITAPPSSPQPQTQPRPQAVPRQPAQQVDPDGFFVTDDSMNPDAGVSEEPLNIPLGGDHSDEDLSFTDDTNPLTGRPQQIIL